jgi:hypothetical protein
MSPDGTMIAVVTSVGKIPGDLNYSVYVNLLRAEDCTPLHRYLLSFPEKGEVKSGLFNDKTYLDHVPFSGQFARILAISPDNQTLAVAYGIYKDPHGYAYFGLYSLKDGHRMATLPGDAYKCGILHGALLSDQLWCSSAPIKNELKFSPDSRTLFTTSEHIRQWDVSGLR